MKNLPHKGVGVGANGQRILYLKHARTHDQGGDHKRSTDRILTTHVGSLVRPPGLVEIMPRKKAAKPMTKRSSPRSISGAAVREVVRKQVEAGIISPATGSMASPAFPGT